MAKKPTAAEKKAAKQAEATNAAPRDLLAEAVAARATGTPLMASEAEMQAFLVDPRGPLVELNRSIQQGDMIAFRATELGVSVFNTPPIGAPVVLPPAQPAWAAPAATPAPAPAPAPSAAPSPGPAKVFAFAAGVPMPSPRRGGRGSTVYGFEQMAVGHSFFIPATDENPNPAKRIASTVSSASTRLEPKKFMARSVTADQAQATAWNVAVGTKGAGIWRTA